MALEHVEYAENRHHGAGEDDPADPPADLGLFRVLPGNRGAALRRRRGSSHDDSFNVGIEHFEHLKPDAARSGQPHPRRMNMGRAEGQGSFSGKRQTAETTGSYP